MDLLSTHNSQYNSLFADYYSTIIFFPLISANAIHHH